MSTTDRSSGRLAQTLRGGVTHQALPLVDMPLERDRDARRRIAAAVCSTPMALVSLADGDCQWFKSA